MAYITTLDDNDKYVVINALSLAAAALHTAGLADDPEATKIKALLVRLVGSEDSAIAAIASALDILDGEDEDA